MKKLISVFLALALCLCSLTALTSCGEKSGKLKVGVIQYMSHGSLDNCYEGVEKALLASGLDIEIDRQIGSSSTAENDCSSFARNMVASGYDMLIAIATPAAVSAFTATKGTDIPVVFCAVNDPVSAKLVDSMDKPGDICTGTSDVLDLAAQVDLIQAMQPDVKTIGILYTSSEPNSLANLQRFKDICKDKNIEVVGQAVQNASDVPSAADNLASKVDCINNFTDNNVVENLNVVLTAAEKYKIPVYGSEVEQVVKGCLAAVSIDYVALGETTGKMAADILNGADASTMAVKTITDAKPVINTDKLDELGLTMPAAYASTASLVNSKN